MPNPRSDDLGSAWTTSTPPSKQSKARRNNTLQDLTTTWTKDATEKGLNPRGPMPDDPKAVPYPEQDRHRWNLEALYGKQNDNPRTRRGRAE